MQHCGPVTAEQGCWGNTYRIFSSYVRDDCNRSVCLDGRSTDNRFVIAASFHNSRQTHRGKLFELVMASATLASRVFRVFVVGESSCGMDVWHTDLVDFSQCRTQPRSLDTSRRLLATRDAYPTTWPEIRSRRMSCSALAFPAHVINTHDSLRVYGMNACHVPLVFGPCHVLVAWEATKPFTTSSLKSLGLGVRGCISASGRQRSTGPRRWHVIPCGFARNGRYPDPHLRPISALLRPGYLQHADMCK